LLCIQTVFICHKVFAANILLLFSICLRNLMYSPFHVLVKPNFRWYFCYISPNQIQTRLDHFKVFDKLSGKIYFQSLDMSILPLNTHCKIRQQSATLWRCRKWAIFTTGVFWENLHMLSNVIENSVQSSSKTYNRSMWWIGINAANSFSLRHWTDSAWVVWLYKKSRGFESIFCEQNCFL